jgi:hypothetical protein
MGCSIAGLLAIGGVFAALHETTGSKNAFEVLVFFEILSGLFWLAGRACRYVLAGK